MSLLIQQCFVSAISNGEKTVIISLGIWRKQVARGCNEKDTIAE